MTISISICYPDRICIIYNMIISYNMSIIVIDESCAYLRVTVWICNDHFNNRVFSIFKYMSPVIIVRIDQFIIWRKTSIFIIRKTMRVIFKKSIYYKDAEDRNYV